MQHAAEFLFQHAFIIAGDGERLLHHVGTMIADGAGRKLDAVADDVVLNRLEAEYFVAVIGIEREKFLRWQIRHRKRIVGEVDFFLLFIPLVHWKVDNPAQFKTIFVDQAEVFGNLRPRQAGEFEKSLRLAGNKEHSIAVAQSQLSSQLLSSLWTKIVGDRTSPHDGGIVGGKKNIAEPRLALTLRPRIHPVAERARPAPLRRDRPHRRLGACFKDSGEHLEPGAAKNVGNVLHLDRVAEIRLVGAVLAYRLTVWNARKFLGHRLAAGKFLEYAADDRLNRGKYVVLRNEAHFQVELIELAG